MQYPATSLGRSPHLSHAFVLRQVPMGHKEAIVLILIFPHVIILILEEKEKSSLTHTHRTQTSEFKASLVSHKHMHPCRY